MNILDFTGLKHLIKKLKNIFLQKNGGTMTGTLDMGQNSIVNLKNPVNNTDAANKKYVDDKANTLLSKSGGTVTGNINMNGKRLANVSAPAHINDATNKKYVDDKANTLLSKSGGTMTGDINMGAKRVGNVGAPIHIYDATNQNYVDAKVATAKGEVKSEILTHVASTFIPRSAYEDHTVSGYSIADLIMHHIWTTRPNGVYFCRYATQTDNEWALTVKDAETFGLLMVLGPFKVEMWKLVHGAWTKVSF